VVNGGRTFAPELLQELEEMATTSSRRQIARHLCQKLDWRGPSGRLQEMRARKLLAKLERTGHIKLPLARPAPPKRRRRILELASDLNFPLLDGALAQLGPIEIVLISSRYSKLSRQWNQLLDYYHYLGAGPLCGDQLRYLVRSAQGVLGALSFSAAARHLRARDQWIGWEIATRRENLHLVVNNSRFLIRPEVKVPHLASHVLGQVLRRLPEDWQGRYGYRPVLVETFVEHGRFRGVSYQAANWQAIGLSSGRGRQDTAHQAQSPKKAIWVYPLQKNFRQWLQQKPVCPRLAPPPARPLPPPPPPPADWAEEEFVGAPLQEARLQRRLCILARDLYARPRAQLPQACGSRAKTKAAYRFLSHPRVSMPALLQSHYQATAQRVAAEPVVLAVQDTTSLNYSAHPATEMLGLIGTEPTGPIGMFVHSTLAFNAAGTPLGLLDVQCWVRDPEDFGKKHQRYELPLEAKESVRWLRSLEAVAAVQVRCPPTRLVSVGDREADIYELFVWAQAELGRPALLVRAERDRILTEDQGHLWEQVPAAPLAGMLELKVPRRGAQPARQAVLEVRYLSVELKAPKRKTRMPSVQLWAVLAREVNTPEAIAPVEWMLLSTLPVENFDSALEKLRWYAGRWGIEVFHRVLKSGCQIETRQLAGADRLEACLAIDMVVAWRIFHLTKLGRETPEVPCTVYFEEQEWKALLAYVTQKPESPPQPPTLREAVRMVASLGGFMGRKSDGEPGTQTIWLGLQRLDDLAAMYLVMSKGGRDVPTVSSNRTYG
jgi:uncharacterized protein DUF4338/transposase Tn5 family protein/transposase-like protein